MAFGVINARRGDDAPNDAAMMRQNTICITITTPRDNIIINSIIKHVLRLTILQIKINKYQIKINKYNARILM